MKNNEKLITHNFISTNQLKTGNEVKQESITPSKLSHTIVVILNYGRDNELKIYFKSII